MTLVFLKVLFCYALWLILRMFFYANHASQTTADEALIRSISARRIQSNLAYVSSFVHVAGTRGGRRIAEWICAELQDHGLLDSRLEQFDVYLNHPQKDEGRRVAVLGPEGVLFEAQLDEDIVYEGRDQPSVFHGYSKSANVSGHLIYANYGAAEDFAVLESEGISVTGAVVLIRYYRGSPASKIKRAELAGASGVLLYSDPGDDGFMRGRPFPAGPYRPPDGVLQSSVSQSSFVVGDPLSPGFPSLPGSPRYRKENVSGLNNIPSLPLPWRDAHYLLRFLQGHGHPLNETDWMGGVQDFEWWTGDKSSPITLLQNNLVEDERRPIYNVLAEIAGWEQEAKTIILGNHHDSWCYGAVDAGSGIAVFLEVARAFAGLTRSGWRPRRTIRFASWDAEEYNLVGSTEHVEARLESLRRHGVAYVNVDVAVSGDNFIASGSAMLKDVLNTVLAQVSHPRSNMSMLQEWSTANGSLDGLSAGSDYVAFQDLAGVPSIDLGFTNNGPQGFPYHSCYDCFEWMTSFGDANFEYHKTMGQILALLILHLADDAFVPLDLISYAQEIIVYVENLSSYSESISSATHNHLDVKALQQAAELFYRNARTFEGTNDTPLYIDKRFMEQSARLAHNDKRSSLETNLLDPEGMRGREQFKHIIYSPQAWPSENSFFPGPRDAIEAGDWEEAQRQADKAARILADASNVLLL